MDFIDRQYGRYMNYQFEALFGSRTVRRRDPRVHCCLYFLAPTGRGLKSTDLVMMRHLQARCNVVPVIGRADALTADEMARFKATLRAEFSRSRLQLYMFPGGEQDPLELDGSLANTDAPDLPCAVVCSNRRIFAHGEWQAARTYPWGSVFVSDESVHDFARLRRMLLGVHYGRLCSLTHSVYYEFYRQSHRKLLVLPLRDRLVARLTKQLLAVRGARAAVRVRCCAIVGSPRDRARAASGRLATKSAGQGTAGD